MPSLSALSPARIAGLLYLVVVLAGIFSLGYVPSQTFVPGDAERTVGNIVGSMGLFRLGVAAGFICYVAFLLLPLALYRVFAPVDRTAATLMVVLAVISVPISLGNLVNKLDVISLLGGDAYLSGLPSEQVSASVMASLERYGNGVLVAALFWGLWLLPLGYLVLKSGLIPRVLGVFLILGGLGYVVEVLATTIFPSYPASALSGFLTVPASIGEIGTCLWLLLFGARGGTPTTPGLR